MKIRVKTFVVFILLGFGLNLICQAKKENNKPDEEVDLSITQTENHFTQSVWRKVQKKAKDTVVQLFVENSVFNWLEPHKSPKQSRSYGSGFFISDDGYIVSNFHVVDDFVSVKIQLPSFGKEQFDVDVVGVCPYRDISLLKLKDKVLDEIKEKLGDVPYLTFGDSDKVLRTQQIMALGYPLGQEKLKSTQGIVSGRERLWGESYIQITAAINPGNSGGPSLNSKGEVIGINTAGISSAQNIGYIIPINDVKKVIESLHKTKLLKIPILGSEFNYGNDDMIQFLKNPKPGGLYVSRVYPETLFEKVGIKQGDMIYEFNGHRVDLYGEISVDWSEDKVSIFDLINRFIVGQKIKILVYRDGKKKNFDFKFELLEQLPIRVYYPTYEKIDYEIIGGMVIMELSLNHVGALVGEDSFLVKYKKRENQYDSKLIITHIFPNSQLQQARVLGVGDIVEFVNGEKVTTLSEFRDRVKKNNGDRFLTIRVEDKRFAVLSVAKILEEEDGLSNTYFYKKSKLIDDLGNVKSKDKKKIKEVKLRRYKKVAGPMLMYRHLTNR